MMTDRPCLDRESWLGPYRLRLVFLMFVLRTCTEIPTILRVFVIFFSQFRTTIFFASFRLLYLSLINHSDVPDCNFESLRAPLKHKNKNWPTYLSAERKTVLHSVLQKYKIFDGCPHYELQLCSSCVCNVNGMFVICKSFA